jgi:hypothetical protein
MPVDTPHPDYIAWAPIWQTIRDVDAGEHVVKGKGINYLPTLSGMDHFDYQSYLINARLYNATGRTIQGLLGAVFRVPPVTEVPTVMEEWLRDIDLGGLPLDGFLKKQFEDKLKPGRYGIRVDMRDEIKRAYFAPYTAENIISWREGIVNGRKVPTRVVLKETEVRDKAEDEFVTESFDIYHVLDLVNGKCRLRVYRKEETTKDPIQIGEDFPNKQGVPLDFIPFVFDGVSDTTPDCEKPPLLDLVSVNLGHYRSTADYYDAQRFSSKPQGWVAGAGTEQQELRIGSRVVWMLPLGATTGYLEFTGQGISAIRQSLMDDESRMARLGAAVIEEPKEGVESAETSRINQSGKTSVLASLTSTTNQAASIALRYAAWWGGLTDVWDDPRITCTLNQDFFEARLSPSDLLSLIQSWQGRGISRDTLTYNIKRGGLLPEGRTIEDEIALIDAEAPLPTTTEEEDLDDGSTSEGNGQEGNGEGDEESSEQRGPRNGTRQQQRNQQAV